MNILDAMLENSFKKLEDGSEAFYPWGIFGKGRIIPNQEEKKKLQNYLRFLYITSFIIMIIMIATRAYIPFILLSAIITIIWQLSLNKQVKNYKISEIKITYSENMKKSSKNYPAAFKWFGLIMGIFMALLGLLFLIVIPTFPEAAIGIFLIIAGVFCIYSYGKMLKGS